METKIQLEPIRDVEAQLRTWDIEQMTEFAQKIPEDGTYLEIGTKYGGSAYIVRCHSDESVKVFSVDPNPLLFMFKGQENNVGITWLKDRSLNMAKIWEKDSLSIDLLFIDGDHGEGVRTAPWDDFNAWEKFVPSKGVIIMHDYHQDFPAVVDACNKILETGKYELLRKPPVLAGRQDTDMFIVKKI